MSRESRTRKELRNAEAKAARRRNARRLLQQLGLWKRLESTKLSEVLVSAHYPQPEVQLGAGEDSTDETQDILKKWGKVLSDVKVDCPVLGEQMTVVDYLSTVKPLLDVLGRRIIGDASLASYLDRERERLKPLASSEFAALGIMRVFRVLENVLLDYGRIDKRLYFVEHETGRNSADKFYVKFKLRSEECNPKTICGDAGPRPAFRCGQPFGLNGIEWVQWPAELIGVPDSSRAFPVFVQSHALDNLYKKEARALFIDDGEGIVHDYLWQSLREPKLHRMREHSRKFLVEFWLNAHKLGYLVAHRMEDVVLIETFLFLTMSGTPEGSALHERLQLSRADREHLALDQVRTFLLTDIQFDPQLVQLLSECGCGHLFRILKDPKSLSVRPGYAEETRRFLGLDK